MSRRWVNGTNNGSRRAQRFAIPMPLQYRPGEDTGWREGWVENVSRSGVLFQTDRPMDVATPIEMRFELPVEMGGEVGAQVICWGEVVRTVLPATSDSPPALAARILDYRFVRGANGDGA